MAARKKLTQRQSLNVMTVAVAFMILIFVIIGKIYEDKTEPPAINLPFAELTQIIFGDWQLSFEQEQWRQQPNILNRQEEEQLLTAWQTLTPYGWTNQPKGAKALSLDIKIRDQNHTWFLILADQPMLQQENAEQAIILTKLQLSLLLPEKLLRSQVN